MITIEVDNCVFFIGQYRYQVKGSGFEIFDGLTIRRKGCPIDYCFEQIINNHNFLYFNIQEELSKYRHLYLKAIEKYNKLKALL
jgi:hypothetical protein